MVNPTSSGDCVAHAGGLEDFVALNVELYVTVDTAALAEVEFVCKRVIGDRNCFAAG